MYKNPVQPSCDLSGDNFSPATLRGKIPELIMKSSYEPNSKYYIFHPDGEKKLRYGNRQQGGCSLFMPEAIKTYRVEWFFEKILSYKALFIEKGVTDPNLWIYWYGNQGSMELGVKEIALARSIGWSLGMDYIYTEDEEGGIF